MPLILVLYREKQANLWILRQSEFLDSQGYAEKPCLRVGSEEYV